MSPLLPFCLRVRRKKYEEKMLFLLVLILPTVSAQLNLAAYDNYKYTAAATIPSGYMYPLHRCRGGLPEISAWDLKDRISIWEHESVSACVHEYIRNGIMMRRLQQQIDADLTERYAKEFRYFRNKMFYDQRI